MEIKGELNGVTVIDDYGHHPTEVKTTLQALKECWPNRRKVVVFQPHRFTRTQALFAEFTRAFYQSDVLLVMPIYAASETPIPGIEAEKLVEAIRAHGHKQVHYCPDKGSAVTYLADMLAAGDVVLTLGAGDVHKIGPRLLERLAEATE